MDVLFPVFVVMKDCGEISVFHTLDDLQNSLEPMDVENGEYDAYDGTGTPVRLVAAQEPTWLTFERVYALSAFESLEDAVAQYAARSKVDLPGPTRTPEECVSAIATIERSKDQARWLRRICAWFHWLPWRTRQS